MRWGAPKFALFAVIALLFTGVFIPAPAAAAPTVETEVGLFWRDQVDKQPVGDGIRFFVAVVSLSGSEKPSGPVTLKVDTENTRSLTLKDVPSNDELAEDVCGDDPCRITGDVELDLGLSPHFFVSKFEGNDTFKPSTDELGFARGVLNASSDQSEDGDLVTYTFQLLIASATPSNRRPKSPVDFSDDQGHASRDPLALDSNLRASWSTQQNTGFVTTTATYSAGGEDVFLPVTATRSHSVTGRPQPTNNNQPPASTATTRRTTTTRRTLGRTPTTAALAPITPGATTTTIAGDTTSTIESFGDFTTSAPSTTGEIATASNNDEGPPIAVVATTLLALGALGGVAAFRRYRKGGIDWF